MFPIPPAIPMLKELICPLLFMEKIKRKRIIDKCLFMILIINKK